MKNPFEDKSFAQIRDLFTCPYVRLTLTEADYAAKAINLHERLVRWLDAMEFAACSIAGTYDIN